MLQTLSIKNFAIIEELSVDFGEGLNIFTGETGVGKSIIIGALELLLGGKAKKSFVRSGSNSCEVSALFQADKIPTLKRLLTKSGLSEDEDASLLLKRTVSADGKSRCFANGQVITLKILEDIGKQLIDIHGQHEHQALLDTSIQRELLDDFGGLSVLAREVSQKYSELKQLENQLEEIESLQSKRLQQIDLYQFQVREIEEANLKITEEEEIKKELLRLDNAEKLFTLSQKAHQTLYESEGSLSERIAEVKKNIVELARIDERLKDLVGQVEAARTQIEEISRTVGKYTEETVFDPARQKELNQRLDLIGNLERKYGNTISEILQYKKRINTELNKLVNYQESGEKLKERISRTRSFLFKKAQLLSQKRKATARRLQSLLEKELKQVGMERTKFEVNLAPTEISSTGREQVKFFISPNPGEPLRRLEQIASGGELSRVMLTLKTILARADRIPVLIFDEIDVGIGGKIAEVVGKKLRGLTDFHQVICVTHLPQIAAFGQSHFYVTKQTRGGRTRTSVKLMGAPERVKEIARMVGGEKLTPSAIKHAEELLKSTQEKILPRKHRKNRGTEKIIK